jgi:hypothetical protein
MNITIRQAGLGQVAAIVPEQATVQGGDVGGKSQAENHRPKDGVAELDRPRVGVRRLRWVLAGASGCRGSAGICGPCSPILRHRATIPKFTDVVERRGGLARQVFSARATYDPLFDPDRATVI